MFFNGGTLLVLTLTIHAQPVKEQLRYKRDSDDMSVDDFIMNRSQESKGSEKKETTFENYLKKFEPSTIWEQIDKQKKQNGLILSNEEHSETMFQAMDPTNEIMELKLENGNPKVIIAQGGRRWKDPNMIGTAQDRFQIRNRMYELMKQALYSTRNKLVIMQLYREKYRDSILYKMGFLMNKIDNAAKTFGKFSYRAYRGCLLARERINYRLPVQDLLSVNERQLNLWFNIEILGDLIFENDKMIHEVFQNYTRNISGIIDHLFID